MTLDSETTPSTVAGCKWPARWQVWLGAFVVLRFIPGLVQMPQRSDPRLVAASYVVVAAVVMALVVGTLATAARGERPSNVRSEGLLILVGLGAWLALMIAQRQWPGGALGAAAWGSVQDGAKLLAAGMAGMALSRVVRDRNILLPAAIFAAFADVMMVNYGTVNLVLQSEAGTKLLKAVSTSVPTLHASMPAVSIGPADLLFLGFFLKCAHRLQMNFRWTVALSFLFLTAALASVPMLQAVPALAPLGVAFILANLNQFRFSRSEWVAMGVVAGLVALLTAAFFIWVALTAGG